MKKILFSLSLFFLLQLPVFMQDNKEIKDIFIDVEKKEIRIKCKLAIEQGILEYLLVEERGKTYESILKVVENKPSDLQFALLLLGFEPLSYKEYQDLRDNPQAPEILKDKNCLLEINVWHNGESVPFSTLLSSREEQPEADFLWVFTGSFFSANNKYVADLSGSCISIWPDLEAVVNLLSSAGNPYRGELGFEMAANLKFKRNDDFILILKGVK